jgi:hypothetical protein
LTLGKFRGEVAGDYEPIDYEPADLEGNFFVILLYSAMASPKPVSDARKKTMKVYYDQNREAINTNRLLNRVKSGKQKGIQRAKFDLYNFTEEERDFLEPLINEKLLKKREISSVAPRLNVELKDVFTIDQFEAALLADKKTATTGSKAQWRTVYRIYKRLFDFDDSNFTDFLKFDDDEIAEILTTAYPNVKTRIKSFQFIPKLYNMMKEPFQKFLTEARYKVWDRKQNDMGQLVKASTKTRKETTGVDYVPQFIQMFKNELELRAKSPGSVQHALAVLYTIGVYENLSKLNEPTFIPRLDYDDVTLVDDDSEIDKTNKKNFYNMKTGRLVMGDLKTDRFYVYDYILNPTTQKFLNMYLAKSKKKVGDKMFKLSSNKMSSDVKKAIGIGNREYRRAFQNIYHKIFKVAIEKMSAPFAHDLDTAQNTYMDSYVYTEADRKIALNSIKAQIASA